MKNRVVLIVPYFGKLPDYFQLFLDSCSCNHEFDWLIFSDDTEKYNYPSNVHFEKMSFNECKSLIQSKFDFTITLPTPQKLCDFKCSYGYIFADNIKNYDWWGHCDLDQIFGKLSDFITDDMLSMYDKIGSLGHLTLYRNTADNNTVFMNTDRYRQVFTTEKACAFDEWLPDNINEIYLDSGRKINLDNYGADINPYLTTLSTVKYDLECRCYTQSNIKNSVFKYDNGNLTQLYLENGEIKSVAYPYVHLQKRKMTDCRKDKLSNKYYIIPNKFMDESYNPVDLIHKSEIWKNLNYQFFKVKINSLKYRIKNSDWNFSNVFK